MNKIDAVDDNNPVLDRFGNVDLEYYYTQANELKAEYISSIYSFAFNSAKKIIARIIEGITCPKCIFTH